MSVLRYPGGKTRAIKILLPYLPNDLIVLYSPFFGGGSLELTCAKTLPNLQKVYGNDKFQPLIDFWKAVQSDVKTICDSLYTIRPTITKEIFNEYRKTLNAEICNLQRAVMYFVINRCSFSGATFSGGFSDESSKKRFTISSIDRIKELDLSKIEFSCLDFTDFFSLHNDALMLPGHYIYADPPYMLGKGSKLYGTKGDLHEDFDHKKFKECICKFPNWIISYNDTEEIRELYVGYEIKPLQWAYGMNKSKTSSEIVILSRKSEVEKETA